MVLSVTRFREPLFADTARLYLSVHICIYVCDPRVLVLTLYFEDPIDMCGMRLHCVCVDILNIELFIYTAVPILRG